MAVVGTATVEIHAALDAVREEVKRGIDEAFAGLNTNVKVSVDTTEAEAKIDALKNKLGLGSVNVSVNADTGAADAKLGATKTIADSVDGKKTVTVDADTGAADAKLATTAALAKEAGKDRKTKVDANTDDAQKAIIDLGTVLDKLGLQADAFGTGTQLKIGAIAGAIPTVGAAIGSAFAALPALLAAIGAGAGAVMVGFSGVGTVIKGMSPDATAADMKKMNQELAQMGPNAQAVSTQLGAMVNGPLHQLKSDIQENLLGKLNGDFSALSTQTLPIVDTGMKNIAGTMGTGLHNSIQTVISSGPQLTSMFGGMNDFLGILAGQSIPSFIQSFINMGGAAAGGMKAVGDGINSIFTGFQSMIDQQVKLGTFQQAVSGLGPIFAGLGNVLNPLLGMVITLGANLAGPLSGALTAIGNLIAPLTPILSSVGQQFLAIVTVVAQQLLPIFTDMTPAFEDLVNSLGQMLLPILQAVGPAVGQLVQGFLQFAKAMEPLYGPTSLTVTAMQGLGQIMQAIAPLIGTVGTALGQLVDALSKALAPVIPIIVSAVGNLANALGPVVTAIGDMAVTLIEALAPSLPIVAQALSNLLSAILPVLPALSTLAGTVIRDLAPILPALATAFVAIVNAVVPLVPVLALLIPPFTTLVNVLLPPLVGLLTFVADHAWIVVAAFSAWAAIKVAETVAGWGTAISGGLTQLSYLNNAAGDSEGAIKKMVTGFKAIGDIPGQIGPAAAAVKQFGEGLASSLLTAGKAVAAFSLELLASPITWIVLGIAALIAIIVLLITHWDDVKRIVGEVWDKITGFATWLGGVFVHVWDDIVNAVKGAWDAVTSWFGSLPSKVGGWFADLGNAIADAAKAAWHWLVTTAEQAGQDVLNFISTLPNKIVYGLGELAGMLVRAAIDGWHGFTQGITTAWDDTVSFIESIPSRFMAGLAYLGTSLVIFATTAWHGFTSGITTAWDNTVSFVESIPGRFMAGLATLGTFLGNVATTAWHNFTTNITTAWDDTVSFVTSIPGRFMSAMASLAATLGRVAVQAWDGFTSGIATAWIATGQWLSSLPGRFLDFFKSAGSWLANLGTDIWDGFIHGLEAAWNAVWNWVTGIIKSFIDGFKHGLGISSPSSVFAEIGQWIFEGLWNGLKAIWNAIISWISAAITDFINFFKGLWTDLQNFWNGFWSGVQQIATTVWNAIKTFLTNEMNGWANLFSAIWNGIKNVFQTVWNFISNIATTVWNAISSFFTTAFNAFVGFFQGIWNSVSTFFSNIWNGIKTAAENIWNAISGFFVGAFNAYVALFQSIWNNISAFFSAIWNAIRDAAVAIWNAISSFFTGAFNGFVGFFQGVWTGISTFFSNIWNGIKTAAVSLWNEISGFFTGAFNGFVGFFQGIWNNVGKIFSDVWNGIKGLASTIWGDISGFFVSGINGVIGFLNGMIHGINKVLGWVSLGPIGDIPRLAAGGVLTISTVFTGNAASAGGNGVRALAAGGPLDFAPVGGGFKTNGPKAIVGEGNPRYPEYVIPTDPSYRGRARNLMSAAAKDMGLMSDDGTALMAFGGVVHPRTPGGVPMLGLGDALSSFWDATGGQVVSAAANVANSIGSAVMSGINDVEGLLAKGVNIVIDGIAHGAESLMPNNLIGQYGTGLIEKMKGALESWIGTAANTKQQQNAAAAASAVGVSGVPSSHAGNVAIVQNAAAARGWNTGVEWNDLVYTINRESGFNNVAQNPTSTAYGMFQFLDTTWQGYGPKTSDPALQARYGMQYIANRYGDPIGAWNHETAFGWYDNGGFLPPGLSLAKNDTGQHEMVLPDARLAQIIESAWGTNLTKLWSEWNHGLEQAVKRAYGDRAEDKIEDKIKAMLRESQRPPVVIPPPPPLPPLPPQTSTAVAATLPGGDLGAAFRTALSQFAPELSQAISAGSATQIVTLGQALLANPQRMAALNQSIADALGTSVTSMAGQVQDVISSALPTARTQGGTVDPTMGAAGTLRSAQSTVNSTSASSSSSDVTIHPGAFQVTVAGNADAVTIAQLQTVLKDWNDELLHQVRGRR